MSTDELKSADTLPPLPPFHDSLVASLNRCAPAMEWVGHEVDKQIRAYARAYAAEAVRAAAPRWIPVSERPPEPDRPGCHIEILATDGDAVWDDEYSPRSGGLSGFNSAATHWMLRPPPAPPESKGGE